MLYINEKNFTVFQKKISKKKQFAALHTRWQIISFPPNDLLPWRWRNQITLKLLYISITLHGATSQKKVQLVTHAYMLDFFWHNSPPPPQLARTSLFTRFLDHIQRCTTVSRTPLDEWSARRRDLYLTIHNTHNRQTSMSPVGFEPTISAGERPQTYPLDRAAIGTGMSSLHNTNFSLFQASRENKFIR
jgi:hypothetical protein